LPTSCPRCRRAEQRADPPLYAPRSITAAVAPPQVDVR
jgi:hypothetical protein